MGLFKKDKNALPICYLKVDTEIGALKKGNTVKISLYDEYLQISQDFPKQDIKLNYSKISSVYYGKQEEVIEKDKSMIGRAVAGGLLFGGAGAIVGAMTGLGKKQTKTSTMVFVISYKSTEGNDDFLAFVDPFSTNMGALKVYSKLLEFTGQLSAPKAIEEQIEL